MLSSVLNSKRAIHENFQIVFEAIKQLIETEFTPEKKIDFTVKEKQASYGRKSKGKGGIKNKNNSRKTHKSQTET